MSALEHAAFAEFDVVVNATPLGTSVNLKMRHLLARDSFAVRAWLTN